MTFFPPQVSRFSFRRVCYDALMEVIYADSVFFLDLTIDYLLCLAAGRICGVYLKRLRYLAAAILGAIYSVAVLLPGFGFLAGVWGKLGCGLLMGLIAFGGERQWLKCTGMFFAVSSLFAGALWGMSLASGAGRIAFSPRLLLFSFSVCYAGVELLFRRKARSEAVRNVEVSLTFLGREARFTALPDTGNTLSDPVTGCRVMVISPHALSPIFASLTELFSLPDPVDVIDAAGSIPELRGKLRLIPYSAVGGRGMLPAFRPERISVDGKAEKELLAAVSPTAVGDGYEAIL